MRRVRILVVAALAAVMLVASASSIQAQTVTPCMGGCDGEYPVPYDVQAMRATYGYPTYYNGCWWYDGREIDGLWWYMCPTGNAEPHNLYPYDPYG